MRSLVDGLWSHVQMAELVICGSKTFASPTGNWPILRDMPGQIKNVIFLGAGASKADGAPLQFELLRDYFKLDPSGAPEAMDLELKQFFQAFYNIDVTQIDDKTTFPTFEEVLGALELALQREENFKVAGTVWDQYRIRRCREYIVTLICIILAAKLGAEPSGMSNHHSVLVGVLPADEDTCFISLNYDLLIDNAMRVANRTPEYGTEFANSIDRLGDSVGLYKLHGSLNWLRCPTCSSLTHTGSIKGASYPTQYRARCQTPNCNAETTPIVIPPTFFKVMSDFHLEQVWHRAELALLEAERIFFCGYSLPDADMHIRYLLKKAEVNRGSTPDVFIISNHDKKEQAEKKTECARFKRLFRLPSKVVYTNLSFEQFVLLGPSRAHEFSREIGTD